jgi:hypothetical protein
MGDFLGVAQHTVFNLDIGKQLSSGDFDSHSNSFTKSKAMLPQFFYGRA